MYTLLITWATCDEDLGDAITEYKQASNLSP